MSPAPAARTDDGEMSGAPFALCRAELVAVLAALRGGVPEVLTLQGGACLPAGPLESNHASLQRALRSWVQRRTGFPLGHVEQLYTFGDAFADDSVRTVRISYMALARQEGGEPGWRSWYDYFPWEDRRDPAGFALLTALAERLTQWADGHGHRLQRLDAAFGCDGRPWNDEAVLQRYELLWEAGLVSEAEGGGASDTGRPMLSNHRRILATAMSRLRAKSRYTPVVFDLIPEEFTLFQLQQAMEAVAGRFMHKQNFRRLVLGQKLVIETDRVECRVHGRPARLYRFRPQAAEDCYLAGAKLPVETIRCVIR